MCSNDDSLMSDCSGLDLSSADGVKSLIGSGRNPELVEMWLKSGSVAVLGSPLDSVRIGWTAGGTLVVQDSRCSNV